MCALRRRRRRRQRGSAVGAGTLARGAPRHTIGRPAFRYGSASGLLSSASLLARSLLLLRIASNGRLDETDELGRLLDLLSIFAEVLREDVASELDVRVRGTDVLQHHVRLAEEMLGLSDRNRIGAVDELGKLAVLKV